MAKQLVNPIERHVEKGILAIAGLVLIAAIARFGVSTPNRAELAGETVTPATIDEKVRIKAETIRERVRNAKVEVKPLEPLVGKFVESLATLEPREFPLVSALGPDVPLVDRGGPKPGQHELVKVLTPAKPILTFGRSVYRLAGAEQVTPSNWVSISSAVNIKLQSEAQKKTYGSAKPEVVYGPFEIQRRTRRPDGSWSDGDWASVSPWPGPSVSNPPRITLTKDGDKYAIPKDFDKVIQAFYDGLAKPEDQLSVLRPLMPEIPYEPRWKMPVITSYDDVLKQDDEFLFPNQAPSEILTDRYGGKPVSPTAEDPAKRTANRLKELDAQLKTAKQSSSLDQATIVYNQAQEITQDNTASETERTQAKKLLADADQAIKDIKRRSTLGGPPPPGGATTPVQRTREKLPVQQVWAHDAKPGSVQGGTTYQYRIRANLFNRLAGDTYKFANPTDAAVVYVPSDWSEPSDPITIAPTVEFFVTGEVEKSEEVKIEIYQWYDGVWVQSKSLLFAVGDAIRGKSRESVPAVTDRTVSDSTEVDFDTEAVIVDIDFKRSHRERKKGTGKTGVKIGAATEVPAVAYVGSDGGLHERLVPTDKAHPAKKAATERLYKASKPK